MTAFPFDPRFGLMLLIGKNDSVIGFELIANDTFAENSCKFLVDSLPEVHASIVVNDSFVEFSCPGWGLKLPANATARNAIKMLLLRDAQENCLFVSRTYNTAYEGLRVSLEEIPSINRREDALQVPISA